MIFIKNESLRNDILFVIDSMLYTNAITFISINAVIPYFLIKLGATNMQISISNMFVSLGFLLPQLFVAKWVLKMKYKSKSFAKVLFFQRILILPFIIAIAFTALRQPKLTIALFLIWWAIFCLFTGAYSPFFVSIITKSIPYAKRGKIIGIGYALGSLTAVGSAYILNIILTKIKYPDNYSLVFILGLILLFLDIIIFLLIKEPADEVIEDNSTLKEFLIEIPKILKSNKGYLNVVIGFIFLVIANLSLPYYAVYATKIFRASPSDIAILMTIGLSVGTISNLIFASTSNRIGHRNVLIIAAIFGILAGTSVLLIKSMLGIFIAFGLSSVCNNGYAVSSMILLSRYAPQAQISLYCAISNTCIQISSSIMFLLSGFMINAFGFVSVFIVSLIFAIFAMLQMAYRVLR